MSTHPDAVPSPASLPPGVSCQEHSWGRIYRGPRDALVAAGLVPDGCLPGDPGMPRWARTFEHGGRHLNVTRVSTRSRRLELRWPFTPEERAALARNRDREEAFARLAASVAALPNSAADYREEAFQRLRCLAADTAIDLCRRRGGYRFDAASRRAIVRAVGEFAQAVARATVTFDPATRDREVAGIYDRHAARIPQDDAFERFLQACVAPGPNAGGGKES